METLLFQFVGVALLTWMLVWGVKIVRSDPKQVRRQVRQGQRKASLWHDGHPLIGGE